ncbi:MAG: 2-hydroxyacyl-CoA dehydratase [Promethearchaeota archaeon]
MAENPIDLLLNRISNGAGTRNVFFVGFGHQFFPSELLAAFDVDHVNLIIGGNEAWQTKGIEYLTPTSCVYIRQILGFFNELTKNGTIDAPLTHFVYTNFCNGDYNSSEVVQRYFGIKGIPLHVPYKISAASFKLTVNNVNKFIKDLENITKREYEPERLRQIIEISNEINKKLRDYSKLESTGAKRLTEFINLELAPWNEKLKVAKEMIEKRKEEVSKHVKDDDYDNNDENLNIIVTGSPILLGDRFARILDNLDIKPRFYDFHFADQKGLNKIPESDSDLEALKGIPNLSDPTHQLAAYWLETASKERMVQGQKTNLERRIENIQKYRELLEPSQKIDGIIHHVLKFCDVYGTNRVKFKFVMQERYNIPILDIERDFSTSSVGQLTTRLEAFKEMLVNIKKK